TNAHIVVAEYKAPQASQASRPQPTPEIAVVLSARTAAQLQVKVHDMIAFIESAPAELRLEDMGYTLQVGRDAMDERLAFIAANRSQLLQRLHACAAEDYSAEGTFRGDVRQNRAGLALVTRNADFQSLMVQKWLQERRLHSLLELWVAGLEV